jgi:hypothetical protein
MGNYENLKQSIAEVIRTNGNQEITGAVLQSTLLTIISSVGANATFAGIATPTTNPGTPDGPVFYIATESGTYSNFNAIELQDGLSVLMWNGTWSSQQIFGVDDVPTVGSDNLVKSGGVAEELALGAVYDVSAKNPTAGPNNDGKFESLSALLSDANLNTLVPTPVRKGGMSIKFVQSSDNKYVQYRLMKNTWSITVSDWQGVDNVPTVLSVNLTDSNGVYDADLVNREGIQKSTYGLVLDTDNILVSQGKDFIEENIYYSPSSGGFIKSSGKGCIRFVEVLPSTTYYMSYVNSIVEFNANKEYIKHTDKNPYQEVSIITDENTKYLVLNYAYLNPNYIHLGLVPYSRNNKKNVKNPFLYLTDENFRGFSKNFTKTISDIDQIIYRTLAYNVKQGYYFNNEGNELRSSNLSHSMIFDIELLKNYDLLVREIVSSSASTVYIFGSAFEKLGYYGNNIDQMIYLTYDEIVAVYPTAKYFVVNCRTTDNYPFVAISKASFKNIVTETGQTKLAIKAGDTILFNVKKGDSERISIFGRPTIDSDTNRVAFFNAIPYDGLFSYTAQQDFNEIRVVLVNSTTGSVDVIFDKSVNEILSIASNMTIPTINNDVPSWLRFSELIRSKNLYEQFANPILDEQIEGNVMASMAAKLCYYDGAIYGWKMANDVPDDHPEMKFIYLFKYNISNEQVSIAEVLQPNQELTFTDSTTATIKRPFEGNIRIIDGYLILVNCITDTTDNTYVIQQKYDLSLNLVNTSKCTFSVGENSYTFSVANLKANGLAPYPNTAIGYPTITTLFNSGFAEKNSRYYGVFKVDDYFRYASESVNPLIITSSTDFINWRFENIIKEKGQGEVAIDINNTIMTICIRPQEDDRSNLLLIEKMDMSSWKVLQKVYIAGQRSMPTFFRYGGKLYLLSPGSDYYGLAAAGRNNYKISYIDEYDLRNSCKICDTFGYSAGANTNIVVDGDNNLYIAGTSANIVLFKFAMPLQNYYNSISNFIENTFLT